MDEWPSQTELAAMLRDVIDQKRGYAGFWDFPDRERAELGVAEELVPSLDLSAPWCLRSRGLGNDPPDCEAEDAEGRRIGIEVTELVDPDYASGREAGSADWDREETLDAIRTRLARKDSPTELKGGPYDLYVLIMYTDEDMLSPNQLRRLLDDSTFGPCSLIDQAWIVTSYVPNEAYPTIRLTLRATHE